MDQALVLTAMFLAAALLYASVGHAGASAYLAAMALVGVTPAVMRPTALALNILVASIVTLRFHLAQPVAWRALAPFVVTSVPFAFIGGAIVLPASIYKPLVGVVLLVAAARFGATAGRAQGEERQVRVPFVPALAVGVVIGLAAGLTGSGGGIFLTPLLLLLGWADSRSASGLSAPFILANSIGGLAGNPAGVAAVPPEFPMWAAAVGIGAVVGSGLGSRRLAPPALRRALALVLVVAGLKLILIG